jgi:hypothetical protein
MSAPTLTRRAAFGGSCAAAAFIVASPRPALADLELDAEGRIYRRYALLVAGPRDDERGLALTRAIVDVLAHVQEASRAQVARAADAQRVGLLIATEQRDLGVMSADSARNLFQARPPFEDFDAVPLRVIASFGSHLFVCRSDFLDRHAYLLAKTLWEHQAALPAAVRRPDGAVPPHRGSAAYFAGRALPA